MAIFFKIMIAQGRVVCQEMDGFMKHYETGYINGGVMHKSGDCIAVYDRESRYSGNFCVTSVGFGVGTISKDGVACIVDDPLLNVSIAGLSPDELRRNDAWITHGGRFIFTSSPIKARFLLWGVHYNLVLSGKCPHK